MRKTSIRIVLSAIAAVAVCACAKNIGYETGQGPVQESVSEKSSSIVEGMLEVRFSDEMVALIEDGARSGSVQTKSSAVNGVFSGLGVTSYERVFPDAGEWEERHRKAGLHKWYRVKYDPALATGTKAAAELSTLEGVENVTPVRRIKQNQTEAPFFNDPLYPKMWNLYNDGSLGKKYVAGADVNVLPVWQNYTAGTSDVIVAVVDGGVDMSHEDLAAICIPGGENGSKSFVNGLEGYYIVPDDHGTHVAGTIAAINDNGVGISGIAGGYDGKGGVRIMSCAIFADSGSDEKKQGDSESAIVWAADHGAVICQNSWGYVFDKEEEAMEWIGQFEHTSIAAAIDYFVENAGCDKDGNQLAGSPMKGGVVLFSAGNDTWKIGWPSAYENVVAVGAISSLLTRAYYSNYGDWVDICAPGGDAEIGPGIISSVLDNSYVSMQGTSMACPHVSGVAALIASQFGGQGFTNDMLLERLLKGANNKVPASYEIGPLVDAFGSFVYGGTIAPDRIEDFTVSANSNTLDFEWNVVADEDEGVALRYLIMASDKASDFEDLDMKALPASMRTVVVNGDGTKVGDKLSGSIRDLEFETAYHSAIVAYDYSKNFSELSPVKAVSTKKNNPPVIATDYDGGFTIKAFQTMTVQYSVSDPDGHQFSINVKPGSNAASLKVSGDNLVILSLVGTNAPAGKYTAHIIATDEYGLENDYAIDYEILENHPPQLVKPIDNMVFTEIGKNLELNPGDFFVDEDGEPLKFTVKSSTSSVVRLDANSDKLTLTTLDYGLVDFTLTAADALSKTCSTSFKVLVRSDKEPVDLYPNPVSTALNIRPGVEEELEITITNKAGAAVYSDKSRISPFEPLKVDMTEQPAGVYYVSLKGGNTDVKYSIVKL